MHHDDAYTSEGDWTPPKGITMNCTRCQGSGFINLHQVPDDTLKLFEESGDHDIIRRWIDVATVHDVSVCECAKVAVN